MCIHFSENLIIEAISRVFVKLAKLQNYTITIFNFQVAVLLPSLVHGARAQNFFLLLVVGFQRPPFNGNQPMRDSIRLDSPGSESTFSIIKILAAKSRLHFVVHFRGL